MVDQFYWYSTTKMELRVTKTNETLWFYWFLKLKPAFLLYCTKKPSPRLAALAYVLLRLRTCCIQLNGLSRSKCLRLTKTVSWMKLKTTCIELNHPLTQTIP